MTRGEMNALILSWLDDPNGTYFTPTVVNTWINNAQKQVQLRLVQTGQNWYQIPTQTVTVASQQDYLLPSDFLKDHRIEVVISGTGPNENRQPILPITTNQTDIVPLPLAIPRYYVLKKDRFSLFSIPDQTYVMRLYYSYRVQDLTNDNDIPDIPPEYMEYMAILAAYDGFIKDDRPPENLAAKKIEYETLMKQSAAQRKQDRPRTVVSTNDYQSYGTWY